MIHRRDAIKAAAAAIPLRFLLGAQASQREPLTRKTLMTQDLPRMAADDVQVSVFELQYAPGGSSEAHRHPGHTFVYVLEGALVAKIDDGPETTYKPGQMFYEPPLHLHAVSRNASQTEPAKFLVFRIAAKGQPGTVPAK
jgi:quercetin dioxygenase-like cupin family protein